MRSNREKSNITIAILKFNSYFWGTNNNTIIYFHLGGKSAINADEANVDQSFESFFYQNLSTVRNAEDSQRNLFNKY